MKKIYLLLFHLLLIPATLMAADKPIAKPHDWNMEHCMPGMEAHCRMNEAMQQMEKEMGKHSTMKHCMPDMKAHCQDISDLEYMEKRMENMRIYMQHCMENEKDCPMPEMAGEMTTMRKKMDELEKKMQSKSGIKIDLHENH